MNRSAGAGGGVAMLIVFCLLATTPTGKHLVHAFQGGINRFGTASNAATPDARGTSSPVVGPGPSGRYTVQAQPTPGSCHYRWIDKAKGLVLPDPTCTPGATNPKVTQATINSTICVSGYTASIRPPASITSREKAANAKSYGYAGSLTTGEYDHLIALELGGDPNSAKNLFVQPNRAGATSTHNPKDTVEGQLKSLVCSRKITLVAAQNAIATNWTTALAVVGHPSGR